MKKHGILWLLFGVAIPLVMAAAPTLVKNLVMSGDGDAGGHSWTNAADFVTTTGHSLSNSVQHGGSALLESGGISNLTCFATLTTPMLFLSEVVEYDDENPYLSPGDFINTLPHGQSVIRGFTETQGTNTGYGVEFWIPTRESTEEFPVHVLLWLSRSLDDFSARFDSVYVSSLEANATLYQYSTVPAKALQDYESTYFADGTETRAAIKTIFAYANSNDVERTAFTVLVSEPIPEE